MLKKVPGSWHAPLLETIKKWKSTSDPPCPLKRVKLSKFNLETFSIQISRNLQNSLYYTAYNISPMYGLCRGEGGLKTMITKWYFGKFERTHHPDPTKCHVLSGFDHQKSYTHPIFRNFHRISSCTNLWFWPQFWKTLSSFPSLVPELPLYQFYPTLMWSAKKTKKS